MKSSLKKLLVILLVTLLSVSVCACGEEDASVGNSSEAVSKTESSAQENSTENASESVSNEEISQQENSSETATDNENAFIGTWTLEAIDNFVLVINEDGTARLNKTDYIWYEDKTLTGEAGKEGYIEIAKPDLEGFGDDAYITSEGKLCWENEMTINGESYEQLIFVKKSR